MRKFMKAGLVLAMAATASFANIGTAVTAHEVHHVHGTVQLAATQWASFDVKAKDHGQVVDGSITYTNFDQPAVSDVYRLNPTVPIVFTFGSVHPHTLTITSVEMRHYNSLEFAGSGVLDADHSYTFDAKGKVTGTDVTLKVVYTGVGAGNTWQLTGTIDPATGAISGTAFSPTGSSDPGTWVSPAGTAHSVLSYTADVTCMSGEQRDAVFGFTIPQASVPLGGIPVVVRVQDGKNVPGPDKDGTEEPNKYDSWAHGQDAAPGACTGTTYPQEIIGGHIHVD